MATNEEHQKEADQNYKYFEAHLDEIQKKSNGKKYVLLRHQKVISYHDDFGSGVEEGKRRFEDELYSVQEVANTPIDLGFQSYALFHDQSDE